MALEDIEFVSNPEPRCPVVLLLNTSGSMSVDQRISLLNEGVATFKQQVKQDTTASLRVEVAIITFDSSVELVQDFVTIDNFSPPLLAAGGTTNMGGGIHNLRGVDRSNISSEDKQVCKK